MGCCSSRQAFIDHYRVHDADASGTAGRERAGAAARGGTASRPNKPIRPISPVPKCPAERALRPWTRAQLERERTIFFETRVSGDAQVWAALKLVCEQIRAGDLEAAQTTFDSAGLTTPTGRIKSDRIRGGETRHRKGGIFDEKGHCYEIPGWIMADPGDLAPDEANEVIAAGREEVEKDGASEAAGDDGSSGVNAADDEAGGSAERVTVRARLSDRGTDIQVEVGISQKVRVLVKRIQQEAGLDRNVKLIYLGKELVEAKSLAEQGWQSGHVISVFVFE